MHDLLCVNASSLCLEREAISASKQCDWGSQASSSTAAQLCTPSDVSDVVTADNPVPALQEDDSTCSNVSTAMLQ